MLFYLGELRRAGFEVVVASPACLDVDAESSLRKASDHLILRENTGLDFGSWAACFRKRPPGTEDMLLVCNDSVDGPFQDLPATIDRLTAVDADVYGLVASLEKAPHLQSWFLLLRPAAYQVPAFSEILESARAIPTKQEVVTACEVRLSEIFRAAGLRLHALYDPALSGSISRHHPFNPAHVLWRELLANVGIPFVKADLLRTKSPFMSEGDWKLEVKRMAPQLAAMVDQDIARPRAPAGRSRHWMAKRLVADLLRRDFRLWREGRGMATAINRATFNIAASLYSTITGKRGPSHTDI